MQYRNVPPEVLAGSVMMGNAVVAQVRQQVLRIQERAGTGQANRLHDRQDARASAAHRLAACCPPPRSRDPSGCGCGGR